MKTTIMIFEDNFYRYFTAKHLYEAQIGLVSETIGVESQTEALGLLDKRRSGIVILQPREELTEILAYLKKRGVNRRNSNLIFVVGSHLTISANDQLCRLVDAFSNTKLSSGNERAKAA